MPRVRSSAARLGLVVTSLLILALIVPTGGDLTDHPHWGKVAWIPFLSGPMRRRDIVANLLLFAPIGALSVMAFRRWLPLTLLVAAGLSVFGELTQVYSHSRFPTATDVVCNVAGAVAAAIVVRQSIEAD